MRMTSVRRLEDEVWLKRSGNVFRKAFGRQSEVENGKDCLTWAIRKTKCEENEQGLSFVDCYCINKVDNPKVSYSFGILIEGGE